MFKEYDVIVVGAGHAGCEAAAAAANLGSKVLLITMNMQTIGQMSCNPAMGGVAKGQIVREIDALGGYSGIVTDKTTIQFRMLNRSKGPAMWSPRAQNDRMKFAEEWRWQLENTKKIDFWQDMVCGLLVKESRVEGVKIAMGADIKAKSVVLTNGTFLNGILHIGEKHFAGGRAGEKAATGITEQLLHLGFESGRMKTGTPPRIDGRSINYEKMEIQEGDPEKYGFSFLEIPLPEIQKPCYITYTNEYTHHILRTGFDRSPMFNGRIKGRGPRYCPSIEDKIDRFADKDRHQLFIEPEGWNTVEIYVNGFSTSLPMETQIKALQSIAGLENAVIFRPGYAIEYDYFPPIQLQHTLETKIINGLFFAGQINGTTGYEEAACQGLMAGINAHLSATEKEPFILKRHEAYIGVLIDDLINKGTEEPYRMFTSRAEYRILLRQDNADLRLTERGYKIGLADENRYAKMMNKKKQCITIIQWLQEASLYPEQANEWLVAHNSSPIKQKTRLYNLLLRPEMSIERLAEFPAFALELKNFHPEALMQAEISAKYEGYLAKEKEMVDKMERLENITLRPDFDYDRLRSLSAEAREKLKRIKPVSLAQASRISGVSPADVSVLLVHLGR